MPTATPELRDFRQPAGGEGALRPLSLIVAAAATYAAAELLLTVTLGGYFSRGRAEGLLFFAFRPWLLLAGALLVQEWPHRRRHLFYPAALLLAAASECLFLSGLGASNPWPEAARGLAAGWLLVLVFDLLLQGGMRLGRKVGRWIAAAALALLLAVPNALAPYEAMAIGSDAPEPGRKLDLMLVSALPLVWGEQGPLDPDSRPAAAYQALAEEFSIRPLDVVDAPTLGRGRLLLAAQPRALAPAELVALDQWVRRGGRALLLTDPQLRWPSELPLGDIRRPPAIGLLDPLLNHWGLAMDAADEAQPVVRHVRSGAGVRRLAMLAPGRLTAVGKDCVVGPVPEIARCRIGKGEAMVVADADMMHDDLWTGTGGSGSARHLRVSDNPLLIADWLDALQGVERPRATAAVQWLEPDAEHGKAWLLGLLPILASAAAVASLRISRRA